MNDLLFDRLSPTLCTWLIAPNHQAQISNFLYVSIWHSAQGVCQYYSRYKLLAQIEKFVTETELIVN